jgi:ABC-type transport system involved in multi-copper enzyme maturation permease subunit
VKRLLVLESLKLLPYRSFYLFMALYVMSLLAVPLLVRQVAQPFMAGRSMSVDPFVLPDLWRYLQALAEHCNLLLGVLVITLVGNEWDYRTLRQHVADGLPRLSGVAGKSLLVALLSGFATVLIFVLGAALGHWPDPVSRHMIWATLEGMGRFWLQTFGYLSLAMLAGFSLRRTGMATACFALYILVIEALVGVLLKRWVQGIEQYLPVQVLSGLVESPFHGLSGEPSLLPWVALVLAGGYGVAFHLLSYVLVARSDL